MLVNKKLSRYTINIVILILSAIQGVLLIFTALAEGNYLGDVLSFFTTGMPNPSVCGPLFIIWFILCTLYLDGTTIISPRCATIFAVVFIYFGTVNVVFYPIGLDWPTFVHVLQAYIGYVYFIESGISKYKVW